MSAAGPVLVPGENIAVWPEVKLQRAEAMWKELDTRVLAWECTRPLRTRVIQIAPTEAWSVLDVQSQPPLEVFAVCLGDALHNLRSALDAVVWEMATFEGAVPLDSRRVAMPVMTDSAKFDRWVAEVGSLRPEFVERIRSRQPFTRADRLQQEGKTDTLVLLHDLDILDKHRNSIVVEHALGHVESAIGIKGDTSKITFEAAPSKPLLDGVCILSLKSTEPFDVDTSVTGFATAQLSIPYGGGFAALHEVRMMLSGFVRTTLDELYGDEDDAPHTVVHFNAGEVTVEPTPEV